MQQLIENTALIFQVITLFELFHKIVLSISFEFCKISSRKCYDEL